MDSVAGRALEVPEFQAPITLHVDVQYIAPKKKKKYSKETQVFG